MTKRLILVFALVAGPNISFAGSPETTVAEVKKQILDDFVISRANDGREGAGVSKHGSLEFWSSGGLLIEKGANDEPGKFVSFKLYAKHIEVIPLGDAAAIAMYYSEGSMHPEGSAEVKGYRTRVMVAFVKEDGVWKQRAGHWSPIVGGSGTSQVVD